MNCPNCHHSFEKPPGGPVPYACPHCQSKVLGVYCELTLIGSGAMGDVYRGLRPDMGRRMVAIKLPKAAEARVCHRFEREIAASARLRHENIICAFDRGEEDGRPYLVMEYVSGRALGDLVDAEHPLSAMEVARILRQVSAGLAHAAQHKIVNRDIKPDNILVTSDGTAKILDYGLALIAELDGSGDRVTRNGTLLGTPGFLAPEQAMDPRGVSIAADVYALGCTAHYLLTRRPPFTGKDSFAVLKQHSGAPRPSVRAKRPDVDVALDELIQRMMAVSPEDRPSPRELVRSLDLMIPSLNSARPSLASAGTGLLDARCPSCQEVYHLRANMVGKRIQCRNKLCGQRFVVEPLVGETILYSSQSNQEPAPLNGSREGIAAAFATASVESEAAEAEPLEAVDAETYDAEPVDAELLDAEIAEAEAFNGELPPLFAADAVVDNVPDAEIAEAEALEPPIAEAEIAEAETLPPIVNPAWLQEPAQSARAVAAMATKPDAVDNLLPTQLETVAATAAHIETPPERLLASSGAMPRATPPGVPQTIPAAPAPVADTAKQARPASRVLSRIEQRKRRLQRIVFGSIALMAVAGVALWYFWPKPLTPDERWAQAIQSYQVDRQWGRAKKELTKFAEEFPDHEHVAEIPYFLAMCDVGDLIYSDAYRGKRDQALAAAKKIFEDHRDNPAYKQYSPDLFAAVKLLVEHFLKQAIGVSPPRMEILNQAREAHGLLKTVGESLEDEQAPSQIQSLDQQIVQTEAILRETLARLEILSLLTTAQSKEPLAEIDALYAKVDALAAPFPKLAEDKEVVDAKREAWLAEQYRVRYVSQNESEAPLPLAAAPSNATDNLFIVWDDRGSAPAPIRRREVLTAVSRGVLYVFDAQGNLLWARRLGVDSHRRPLHMPATATSPAALIVVSTEDNTLLSLDAEHGRVLWSYKAGGDISSPLTIVSTPGGRNEPEKQRGLLPTADGNINVLELVLGKQLGRFEIGHPLAPHGGGYDAYGRVAYFPADNQRVFAINPLAIDQPETEPPCKAVLFTGHASGALRSEPTIVDRGTPELPQAYLVMAEATELERMKLRIFDISAARLANPRAEPIQQAELAGWSWFSPLATPDRITLITDAGDLGVFGLNLDNRQEAIYRIIEGDTSRLSVRDRFRSLAIDCDERYLWVMAGGTLRKLKLDVLGQKIRPLWPSEDQPAEVTGVPLHEAQLDDRGDHLFLALMSADGGHFDFVAVDARHGARVWQRQLGVKLVGDPLLLGEKVVVLDQSGRAAVLDPNSDQTVYQPRAESSLPVGAQIDRIQQVSDDAGRQYLIAPLEDARQLALAALNTTPFETLEWQIIATPEPLQGRPCICGEFLVLPGADGILHRAPLLAGTSLPVNEQPVYWMPGQSKQPGPETAEVYALAPDALLLVSAGREIRRLELHTLQNVTAWRQVGGYFALESPVVGPVLAWEDRAVFVDGSGTAHAFDLADPGKSRGSWSLGGLPTGAPFIRGDKLLAVVGGRKLVAVSPGTPESPQPLWTSESFRGRIRGQPLLADNVLLVVDESRRVTAVRLDDGTAAGFVRLPARIGPAGAAVPFGQGRLLVPLSDGTFSVVPIPKSDNQAPASSSE